MLAGLAMRKRGKMNAEDFDSEIVKLIGEIGFIAVSYGLAEHAEKIFEAFKVMRPEQEAGPLGLSLVAMIRDDVDTALKHLEAAPPTDTLQTYRGLTLLRKGDLETAKEILTEIKELDDGSPCVELASQALEDLEGLANPASAMVLR